MYKKPSLHSTGITLFLLVLGLLASFTVKASNDIEQLRSRYALALNEQERLLIAIEAIDKNVIYVGSSVSVVDSIFGTAISDEGFSAISPISSGFVRFQESAFNGDVSIQAPMLGWYLVIKYDHRRVIVDYYLSNISK